MISFSKSLAKELGKYNITVNAVAPGFVETDIIKTIPDHVLQMIIFRVPLAAQENLQMSQKLMLS